ncbi:hypothetical protein G2W53_003501 [Senna tora]|uniref:RNase H type-1 domain-containing protein n=1 Tax=Senna tora TaxID=362788 RepID=A0A834XBD3_9FABA|nr:hypothetical protein G2W53_003501 [Senna tora]
MFLPLDMLRTIEGILPPSQDAGPNKIAWDATPNVKFYVNSTYREDALPLLSQIKAHVGFIGNISRHILKDSSINASCQVKVGWKVLDLGWFKLNSDGSRLNNGRISCGGVLRDHNGDWVFGYSNKA